MTTQKKSEKEQKSSFNYKFLSIVLGVLLGVILVGVAMYFYTAYVNTQGIIQGQENAVSLILQSVNENGEVTIQTPQGNVTLVPKEYISVAQENVIDYIYNTVSTQGNVVIEKNSSSLVLVPQQQ